jgi:hypothetical protein
MASLNPMALAAEAAYTIGDAESCIELYDWLRPHADTIVVLPFGVNTLGAVSLYLGGLATALERWDDAERHLETAMMMHERLRSPPFVARTQVQQAEMLVRRGRPDDRDRARALARSAHETATALGQLGVIRRCESLMQ